MELTVGKFATAVNTTIRTLRYYEKIGLLVPRKKNEANQKVYAREEIKTFFNIQLLKSMGWPLTNIKQMLDETAYSFREMVDMQEAVLLDQRNKINASLEMMGRMKKVIHETGELNNEDMMLLMNAIRMEENQKTILKQYFPTDTVEQIIPKSKKQQLVFDRLNRKILSFFQAAIQRELRPDSQEVQQELEELLALVPANINKPFQSDTVLESQSELLKALLPADMVEFFAEAINVYNTSNEGKEE